MCGQLNESPGSWSPRNRQSPMSLSQASQQDAARCSRRRSLISEATCRTRPRGGVVGSPHEFLTPRTWSNASPAFAPDPVAVLIDVVRVRRQYRESPVRDIGAVEVRGRWRDADSRIAWVTCSALVSGGRGGGSERQSCPIAPVVEHSRSHREDTEGKQEEDGDYPSLCSR